MCCNHLASPQRTVPGTIQVPSYPSGESYFTQRCGRYLPHTCVSILVPISSLRYVRKHHSIILHKVLIQCACCVSAQWSPTYYKEVLNMSPDEAKIHFTLPQLMNLLVKIIVVDPLDSFLIRSKFSQLARRRIFNTAGFMGVAFCMAPVYAIARYEAQSQHTTTVFLTTALLSGAMGFYALLPAGFKANYKSHYKKRGDTTWTQTSARTAERSTRRTGG